MPGIDAARMRPGEQVPPTGSEEHGRPPTRAPARSRYRIAMCRLRITGPILFIAGLGACASEPRAVPPKAPNTELIVGEYERHPPQGETAIRFRADGSARLAKNRAQLDAEPALAIGSWQLDGGKLTLTYDQGICTERSEDHQGVYNVVISRIGIRFTKVSDSCERRSAIDGQTWWRIK